MVSISTDTYIFAVHSVHFDGYVHLKYIHASVQFNGHAHFFVTNVCDLTILHFLNIFRLCDYASHYEIACQSYHISRSTYSTILRSTSSTILQ